MINTKVSIIVALYNKEPYVAETIESVLHQTYTDFELVIVDDGSTDRGGQISDDYLIDQRVRVFHTRNQGMSAARKYGLEQATGEWISILDADDILDENFLKSLCEIKTNADIITTGIGPLKQYDNASKKKPGIVEMGGDEALLYLYRPLDGNDTYMHLLPGKLITRKLFDLYFETYKTQIDALPYNYFDDVFINAHLLHLARTVCVHKSALYKYRILGDSSSHSLHYGPFHYEQVDAAEMVVKMYQELGLNEIYQASLPDFLLVAHKAWYASCVGDSKGMDSDFIREKIDVLTDTYYDDFKKSKHVSIKKKAAIVLFKKNRRLWVKIMDLYFKEKARI